ncbi:hypothetical protein [Saccharopolyspora sp. 5N708]|uniref:hypothetical protein n=1 Tax=Saccharopolyspora sp. 5N708 TaxID=3457424 RepID=UPI003FD0FF65
MLDPQLTPDERALLDGAVFDRGYIPAGSGDEPEPDQPPPGPGSASPPVDGADERR